MLVVAWLNIGFDAVIGAEQHKSQLWKRILDFYEANLEKGNRFPPRTKDGLENWWSVIKKDCKKFRGCLEKAEKHKESGNTNSNTFEVAKSLFHDSGGKEFLFSHCWDVLKDHPIWAKTQTRLPSRPCTTGSSSASPKVVNLAEDVEEVHGSVMHSMPRPPGKRSELKRHKKEQLKEQHSSIVEQALGSWNESEYIRRLEEQRLTMEQIEVDKERMEIEKERMEIEASAKKEVVQIEREKMELQSKTRAIELHFEKEKMKQDRIDKEQARKDLQKKTDMEIMNKDLAGLSDVQIEFFKMCQAEILARWKKE